MARVYQIAIWCLVGIVAALSIASLWSAGVGRYEECEERYASQNSANDGEVAQEARSVCWQRALGDSSDSIAILLTAFATGALVFYTLKLGETGRKQARIADRQAEIADKQFTLSQEVFRATHRPKIIALSCEVTHDNDDRMGGELIVINAGYARATITSVLADTVYTIVPRPGIALPDLNLGPRTVESGETTTIAIIGKTPTASIYQAYDAKAEQKFWCVGRLTYVDEGNLSRTTGFCFLYERRGDRWVRESNPDYEYAY